MSRPAAGPGGPSLKLNLLNRLPEQATHGAMRWCFLLLGYARMAFAYCLIAAGALLLFTGFVGFALKRNALYSTARI